MRSRRSSPSCAPPPASSPRSRAASRRRGSPRRTFRAVGRGLESFMTSRISSPVFVGREAELEMFAAAFRDVTAGEGRLVLIAGEAGIGKSRFVAEAIERLAPQPLVLSGACLDFGGSPIPLAPIAEAFRTYLRDRDPAELET